MQVSLVRFQLGPPSILFEYGGEVLRVNGGFISPCFGKAGSIPATATIKLSLREYELNRFMTSREKQLAAQKRHYEQNKEVYKQRAREHDKKVKEEKQEYIRSYLKEHPCIDCGEADIVVLEFDHREPAEKRFNIGCLKGWSLKTVQAEVAKCDVRCANCHRRKTYREHNGYRLR
jgi:hypothetical protein